MNYINLLKDIGNIKNIRKQQLEKQKTNDEILKILNNDCPGIVAEYLLFQRYLSRIQQSEMIDSNIIKMIDVLHKHFDENNKIYKEFNEILNCSNKCICLENLMKKT